MEGLDLENILDEEQISQLFSDGTEKPTDTENGEKPAEEESEIDIEDLFGGENNEDEIEIKEDKSSKASNKRTSNSVYSSIAKAMLDDDLLPSDLQQKINFDEISTAEDIKALIQGIIDFNRGEQETEYLRALKSGVSEDTLNTYKNAIDSLDNTFTPEKLREESEEGQKLRLNIIYYNLTKNKGYSDEKAKRMIKSFANSGDDVEEAIDAVREVRQMYSKLYNENVETERIQKQREKQDKINRNNYVHNIVNNGALKGIEVDSRLKNKVSNMLNDKSYNGKNAIEMFEEKNPEYYKAIVATLYTLSDGFNDFGKFVNRLAGKKAKEGFKILDDLVKNTTDNNFNGLKLANNSTKNEELESKKGYVWN